MEKNKLVATRIKGKGDTWVLVDDETPIEYPSLTEILEAYVTKTGYKGDYKLSPLKGELYILVEKENPPPEVKKFNLYDER